MNYKCYVYFILERLYVFVKVIASFIIRYIKIKIVGGTKSTPSLISSYSITDNVAQEARNFLVPLVLMDKEL